MRHAIVLAQIGLAAVFGVGASAQELTARPADPVLAAPLGDATGEPLPDLVMDARGAASFESAPEDAMSAQAQDSLRALIASASVLSVAQAQALLDEAYAAYPTPTTRARAFGAAVEAASTAGRHELALAWMDWALTEADRSPEREALLTELLAQGVGVALAAGNPVLARDYVRRTAVHAPGGRDDPAARAVVFDRLKLVCPDVIENAYLRVRAEAMRTEPSLIATPSAECAYVPIEGARDAGFRIHAVRTFIDLEDRTDEVAEQGLDGREVEQRRELLRRLSTVTTVVVPLFLDDGAEGLLAYARHDRLGVDDVAAFSYATAARDGVFYAGAATAREWAWPPEELNRRAEIGLRGALEAVLAADGL